MPFSPEELLARAIVITRRTTGVDRPLIPTITMGEIEIDILSREVRTGTSVIHLSGIEQSLLYLLASPRSRFSRWRIAAGFLPVASASSVESKPAP